jgi:3-hydroxyisobutyrate dehydrogenase
MTTVGIDDIAALAELAEEHGLVLYDAPVSGTKAPAEAGKLLVIAAGPESGRETVQPVFDAVGARTQWTGDDASAGTSTRLKLVVNGWVIAVGNAAGEAVALSEGLGIDPQQLLDLIEGGVLDLPFLRAKIGLITDKQLSPASFAVKNAGKDAHLILDAADAAGIALDGVRAHSERLDRVADAGHGDDDLAASYLASFRD